MESVAQVPAIGDALRTHRIADGGVKIDDAVKLMAVPNPVIHGLPYFLALRGMGQQITRRTA